MSATHASMLTTRKKDRRVTMVVTMVIRYAERTSLQLRLHGVPLVRTDPTRHSTLSCLLLLLRLDESATGTRRAPVVVTFSFFTFAKTSLRHS